ncbi:unnamed protein product [Auanema sp. JU1783]|nr:unnamed protein product [Auanema sp. JU1783]
MSSLPPRMLFVTIVHAIFSQYGDIMGACFNLMNVPIRRMFNESMQEQYGPLTDSSFELLFSACASSMYLGLMIGFGLMGYMMDKIGRKETAVTIRGLLGITGSICMILSMLFGRHELFVVGHIIAGICTGLKVVLIIYVAECSPDSKRGLTSMAINSGGVLTVMVITPLCLPAIFGNEHAWAALPFISVIMAIIHLCVAGKFPQSPKQLYMKKNDEVAARAAILFYSGANADIDHSILLMDEEKDKEPEQAASIVDILQNRKYRFSFFLVLLVAFIPVFSALNVKSQFLISMLMTYGLSQSEATTAMLVISAISLPICFISPFLIHKFGRRPIFATVTILCALEWVGFGFAQIFVDLHAADLTVSWISACLASILGQSAINMGLLIMSPILISEICPHHTRAAISQLTQVFPIGFAIGEVTLFPEVREMFGSFLFFFLGATCAALAFLLFILMGEPSANGHGERKKHKRHHHLHHSDHSSLKRDDTWTRTYGTLLDTPEDTESSGESINASDLVYKQQEKFF